MNTLPFAPILNDPIYLLVSGPVGHATTWKTFLGIAFMFAFGYFVTFGIVRLAKKIRSQILCRRAAAGTYTLMSNLFTGDAYWIEARVRTDINTNDTAAMDGGVYAVNSFMAGLKGEKIRVLPVRFLGAENVYHYVMPILFFDTDNHIRRSARYIWHPSWLEFLDKKGEVIPQILDSPKDMNFFNV